MDLIRIDPTECVICLKIIGSQIEDSDINLQTLEKSLLKLLQIGQIPCEDSTNFNGLFCQNCFSRNTRILSTFAQIEALGKELEDLKNTIEDDFRHSEQIIKERGPSIVKQETPPDLKRCLRYNICKSLIPESLVTYVPEVSAPILEVDWFDNREDIDLEDSREGTPDPYGYLKRVYGIKECSVKIRNLPGRYIIKAREQSLSGSHQGPQKPLKCIFADCPWNKVFKTQAARDEHVESAHGNFVPLENHITRSARFKCVVPGCGASFKQKLQRYLHLRKVHRRTKWKRLLQQEYSKPVFKCIFADCDVGDFHSEKDRDTHVEQEHGSVRKQLEEEVKFKCIFADCSCQSFETKEARDDHVKTAHQDFREFNPRKEIKSVTGAVPVVPPSRIKFFCQIPDCKRKRGFLTEGELDLHKRVYHDGLKKSYPCKECGKYFSKKNLWAHVQVVHLNIRKFICHFCGYACSATPALRRHLVTHTNEKNYKCKICEKEFKTPEGVKIHTRYAHTGERPYRCDRCGKGFVTQGHLGKHLKCVHNKDDRPHICELCGKTFPIHGYLHEHMKNSHGDTPRRRNQNKQKVTPTPKKPKSDPPPYSNPIIPAVSINAEDSSNSYPPEDPISLENSSRYIPSGNFPVNLSFFEDRLQASTGFIPQFPPMSSATMPGPSNNFKHSHPYFPNMEHFGFPRNN